MDTTFFNLLAEVKDSGIWFPTDASASNQVDGLAYFILAICGIFLVFNAGLMVFFALRYRQQQKQGTASGATHNTALEITWSVIPAFILAIIFIWGFRGFLKQATPPDNSYDILVTGYKWGWDFTYPDGINSKPETKVDPETNEEIPMPPALHVPADTPIRLTLQSSDVLHSVFIKELRVKKDVVPGRFNQMWFEAHFDETDENVEVVELPTADGEKVSVKRNTYDLFCTEYCGQNHSLMITKVYVYSPEDYETWYASKALTDPSTPLWKVGETIWATQCKSCHSVEGLAGQGPAWNNLIGDMNHALKDGTTVEANAEYIIESIKNPGAKIAAGYENVMPAFANLTPRELQGVIEYMKTISPDHYPDYAAETIWGDLNNDGSLKSEGEAGDGEAEAPAEDAAATEQ